MSRQQMNRESRNEDSRIAKQFPSRLPTESSTPTRGELQKILSPFHLWIANSNHFTPYDLPPVSSPAPFPSNECIDSTVSIASPSFCQKMICQNRLLPTLSPMKWYPKSTCRHLYLSTEKKQTKRGPSLMIKQCRLLQSSDCFKKCLCTTMSLPAPIRPVLQITPPQPTDHRHRTVKHLNLSNNPNCKSIHNNTIQIHFNNTAIEGEREHGG